MLSGDMSCREIKASFPNGKPADRARFSKISPTTEHKLQQMTVEFVDPRADKDKVSDRPS